MDEKDYSGLIRILCFYVRKPLKVFNEHNRAFKFVEKHYESSLLCLSLALCDIKLFNPVNSHLREKKLSASEDDFFNRQYRGLDCSFVFSSRSRHYFSE